LPQNDDNVNVGKRNYTFIFILIVAISSTLLFQNCSKLNQIASLGSNPSSAQGAKSKDSNPLSEMMNYSEQQIKDTRQKLEKRSDLFGEERLEALKVGAERQPADQKAAEQSALVAKPEPDDIDFEDLEESKKPAHLGSESEK